MKTLAPALPKNPAVASRKLFCRIQEVSKLTGLKPYVLRYWESEFKELAPAKDASDQRRYRQADIEVILAIRKLLYEDRFTIEGARKRLKDEVRLIRGEAAGLDLSSMQNKTLAVDEFIPGPVRRTARRSLADAVAPRPQLSGRLMLRDSRASYPSAEKAVSPNDARQSAAIIAIGVEARDRGAEPALDDMDAHRLEHAMRQLKNEVTELLEMLG
jgi:DNA-binding transcriptional MerR regulator